MNAYNRPKTAIPNFFHVTFQRRPSHDLDNMKSLKELLKFALVIFILIGSFGFWLWWDVRSVRGFCDDVKPGTLVITLSSIAETHHQDTHWLRSSVFEKEKGTWIMFLPAISTFGDVACKIEHDKTVVLTSGMDGT